MDMKKAGTWSFWNGVKVAEEWLFDVLIYNAIVAWATQEFGPKEGLLVAFAIMAPSSAITCLLYLLGYRLAGTDLFGFEELKEVRDDVSRPGIMRAIFRFLMRMGNLPAFIILSIWKDPFMATVYMRRREDGFKTMTGRDWRNFWASVLISNAGWTLFLGGAQGGYLYLAEKAPEPIRTGMLWLWENLLSFGELLVSLWSYLLRALALS